MTTETAVALPDEVQSLAVALPDKKQEEVSKTLQNIFRGTAEWKKQVEGITVQGIQDTMSMSMAKEARLHVKNKRLEFSKILDAKRKEVQMAKLAFDTEDKMWLKVKQIMEIQLKELEQIAQHKEEYIKRAEAEQKRLRDEARLAECRQYNPQIELYEVEPLSDDIYKHFLASLKSAHEKQIELEKQAEQERLEREKKDRLQKERLTECKGLTMFFDVTETDLGGMTRQEYGKFRKSLEDKKEEYDAKQEAMRLENLRLQKEREEAEAKAKKEREEAEKKAEIERKRQEAILAAERKQRAEDAEKTRQIQLELEAKKKAELEAEKERLKKEEDLRKQKELEAKAPIKEKLERWIDNSELKAPENVGRSENVNEVVHDIIMKYNGFKKWAKNEIKKL